MDRTMIERPSDSEKSSHVENNKITYQSSTNDGVHVGSAINSDPPATQVADSSHTAKPTLRPLSEFLIEDPNVYTQEEIKDMLEMIHDGNRVTRSDGKPNVNNTGGGLNPIVKAFGVVGFIRFLDCYYLTLTTRRAKVGSIGDNAIYTIKNTETIPLKPIERRQGVDDGVDPSSVLLSMWNRGKRSVGLGLTNREIAELRYQGLYQVVDLTKNFYFSYTYDMTRSLQENFLSTSTKLLPPPPLKDMYSWNFFLTREFEGCLTPTTSYHWIMPIIHGAFDQRKVNDYGRYLNVTLVARRSRHFAGTRYLKRGVSEQGKVANDVEYEQILHDESLPTPGLFSSFLQVRGSIPTYWTQESSVTMPKPPIELNRVDPTYTATQLHFADLLRRYSSPILVLDLVKQSEKREREVRVGNEFRHAIDYINNSIEKPHKIRYCALDYSHISKHRNLDVSYALNEVATWAVNQTGFFCSDPKWRIMEGGVVVPFSHNGGHSPIQPEKYSNNTIFPMEQSGVLRTNCIDCLDRTNVAQFSAGVEAIGQQLVVMGIRSQCKLGPSSSFVRVLIDLYVDIGDSIALQYGGSEAHKKVTAGVSESIAGPIGKHKELLTSIRRYYSNAFTDRLKQDAMNLFLGYYLPYRHSVPLWELENDYYLHNFHVSNAKNATAYMKTQERIFGFYLTDGDDVESPPTLQSPDSCPDASRDANNQNIGNANKFALAVESTRVARVRRHCNKQSHTLSSWWKSALKMNFQEKQLLRFGHMLEENSLPGRFERVYQPEKLTQFDRIFSRTWETPVRRSHAAQHTDAVDGDETSEFVRKISLDVTASRNGEQSGDEENDLNDVPMNDFVSNYKFREQRNSRLKLFAEYFDTQSEAKEIDSSLKTNPSTNYIQYCEPMRRKYLSHASPQFEEFTDTLNSLTLSADDVAGIDELAQSSHLGEVLRDGEFRGLNKEASAIEVATTLHEQFNWLNWVTPTDLKIAEREIVRKGFNTEGIKESVLSGWNRLSDSTKQYTEILEPDVVCCKCSGLSSANSLKLYVSNFDNNSSLSVSDQIFLQAEQPENQKATKMRSPSRKLLDESFVKTAAKLGVSVTPHESRVASILPPLYQEDRHHSVSQEFEQINEDMFSLKDNKFMVFNAAGVDSWTGKQSITKVHSNSVINNQDRSP